MELFEDAAAVPAGDNAQAISVSEISGTIKRVLEGEFSHIRVRGEIGRVSRPGSGHLYFDLKDDRAVLTSVCWKGQAARLAHRPEEGMEVIATGRLTTFPGQSRYQLVVEAIEPAGEGALMAMLERRRKALAEEGLFDSARKKALPVLPRVIGVVTSPSGAVIRDILHRLRDRFPTHVVVWPVAVQGERCAAEVAAAIAGFNALPEGGPIARPDLIIVARGGGSIEDLWGFNEEIVVRAAAQSAIPLISAVGHETDTTLIDHAADRRAPTPTAAAEMAVPVRRELAQRLGEAGQRGHRALWGRLDRAGQRLQDLGRGLGRPAALTETARQRLDFHAPRLEPALRGLTRRQRSALAALPAPEAGLRHLTRFKRSELATKAAQIDPAMRRFMAEQSSHLRQGGQPLERAGRQRLGAARNRLEIIAAPLTSWPARARAEARRRSESQRHVLAGLVARLGPAMRTQIERRRATVSQLDRTRQNLGYTETLARGFAVIHGAGGVVASAREALSLEDLRIQFADGSVDARVIGPAAPDGTAPPVAQVAKRPPAKSAAPEPAGSKATAPRSDRPTRPATPKTKGGQGSLF